LLRLFRIADMQCVLVADEAASARWMNDETGSIRSSRQTTCTGQRVLVEVAARADQLTGR
jgi:hypothetical protein